MARAQGARAQMALAFETVYGTPPGSGFTQMPFITSSIAAEQPLLASELLGYLHGAPRIDGNPWVITGTLPGKPLSDLQPFWQRVRARAGVKDVRIHDLRHTFASAAVASGQGLPMIGKLLGHTQVQTTARYAHLAAEPVKVAADAVAQNLQQALG
jgi:integrase